jgi:hypothetical protein
MVPTRISSRASGQQVTGPSKTVPCQLDRPVGRRRRYTTWRSGRPGKKHSRRTRFGMQVRVGVVGVRISNTHARADRARKGASGRSQAREPPVEEEIGGRSGQ